ncbi:phage tail domain-containing protein [Ligilactobacillus agilis]|uniref:phage tail domain-containing protein n=1 Tax=Ligilactobacillus agilis TaxID=1601 RepID=UPI00186946FC
MELRYIQVNNKQSLQDFKLGISEAKIGFPAKNKNRIRIPNTNIYYDYATIFGDTYNERIIEYTFLLMRPNAMSEYEIEQFKSDVVNWLMPGIEHKLIDSADPYYYFIAEVQDEPEWTAGNGYGTLKVKFTCYPYKVKSDDEFDDVWDSFDFDNDVAQELNLTIDGESKFRVYNASSTSIYPQFELSSTMDITVGGHQITYSKGNHGDKLLKLAVGWNNISVKGNGSVKIHFHKEVL